MLHLKHFSDDELTRCAASELCLHAHLLLMCYLMQKKLINAFAGIIHKYLCCCCLLTQLNLFSSGPLFSPILNMCTI